VAAREAAARVEGKEVAETVGAVKAVIVAVVATAGV
jgi:hypothetical protein